MSVCGVAFAGPWARVSGPPRRGLKDRDLEAGRPARLEGGQNDHGPGIRAMVVTVDHAMQQNGRRSNPRTLIEDLADLLLDFGERSSPRRILRTMAS